jgi:hypothetical protein
MFEAPPPRTPLWKGAFVGRLPSAPAAGIPVFFGGDYLSGPASVIQAIAAGYQAAGAVYRALGKVRHARLPHWNRMRRIRFSGYADTPALRTRNQMAMEEAAQRCTSFCEICHAYPEQDARAEAERCLRCRWNIAPAPKPPRTPVLRVPKLTGVKPSRGA